MLFFALAPSVILRDEFLKIYMRNKTNNPKLSVQEAQEHIKNNFYKSLAIGSLSGSQAGVCNTILYILDYYIYLNI
jgi:hypothetical protein